MSSKSNGARFFLLKTVSVAAVLAVTLATAGANAPRFRPEDPQAVDRDAAFDVNGVKPRELSEAYDFLSNTFGAPGEHRPTRALNVNTIDEVPDSSWFTSRIGPGAMSIADIVRGPDIVDRLDVDEWLVTGGKGPAGFQPGFRAVNARDPRPRSERTLYQLELDLEPFPDLATGAEMIGTTIYHALGYNVVDVYLVNVDPKKVQVAEDATDRDASGKRRLTRREIDAIFKMGARNPDGTYRMTASRFVEGRPMGNFAHYGTRPDDPNDIYPHEHRRELRANRVYASWLNHDDSRAPNTLDMLVAENGRSYLKHYMFDFGSILGSAGDRRASGFEYMIEKRSTLAGLLTLGLRTPSWQVARHPRHLYPSVGLVEADRFDPKAWKPAYPNVAFNNMQRDDAFWAARLVARFSDEALAAIVEKAKYRDRGAAEYLLSVLIKRRDKVVQAWISDVNPVVNFKLAADGTLTFDNAAVDAKASSPATGYAISWSRFDNATGSLHALEGERTMSAPTAQAPQGLEQFEYVAVTVKSLHPDRPIWAEPVRAYFRREGTAWKTVGLERSAAPTSGGK